LQEVLRRQSLTEHAMGSGGEGKWERQFLL
jgi:hypothetical protein